MAFLLNAQRKGSIDMHKVSPPENRGGQVLVLKSCEWRGERELSFPFILTQDLGFLQWIYVAVDVGQMPEQIPSYAHHALMAFVAIGCNYDHKYILCFNGELDTFWENRGPPMALTLIPRCAPCTGSQTEHEPNPKTWVREAFSC